MHMMSRSVGLRLLLAVLLVAPVKSFLAPHNRAASRGCESALDEPRRPFAAVQSVEGEHTGATDNRLFSARPRLRSGSFLTNLFSKVKRMFRSQGENRRRYKRRALAFALATFVWVQTGRSQQAYATTVANPPVAVEHVQRGGDSSDIGKSKARRVKQIAKKKRTQRKVSATASSGKLAVALAGTAVVAPSAGFVMSRRVRGTNGAFGLANGFSHMAAQSGTKASHPEKGTKPATKSKKETSANFNALREQEKKQVVDKVLKRASASRQKVDSEVYLKSLQKEKSVIHSALESLRKDAAVAPVVAATQQVKAIVSEPVKKIVNPVIKKPAAMLTKETPSTTTELPLMTRPHVQARSQPKSPSEEQKLQKKYAAIPDVGERAYQILVDLGMVEAEHQSGAPSTTTGSDSFSTVLPDEDEEPFQ